MESLKSNEQRGKNAIMLIWIVLVIEMIALVSGYFQYDLLQTAANGGSISTEAAEANDLREQIIGAVYLVAFIISTITFIQWFRRAYYNLHLKLSYLVYSEGWAAGSWFVPIISLYRPYQIMNELHVETKSLLTKRGFTVGKEFSGNILILWWVLWIINSFIGQIIFRFPSETINDLINGTIIAMIGNFIGLPLAIITVKIIKEYANVEPLLHEIKDGDTKVNHLK